jgi:CheY-like chemotaxis protein/two-component sensor histidine kinase
MINSQGNGLLEIIESIFEIIQLETEDAENDASEIQLESFFSSLVAKFENRRAFHKKENIELRYKPDETCENLVIHSDQKKLKIVMQNLVDNALKFTKDGFVEYGFKRMADHVEFFVRDSGVGIDESKKQVIFERFRQADDSHTREFGGIGLGLAVCRKIADLLGAEIDFWSKAGDGTTFIFNLPVVADSEIFTDENPAKTFHYPDLSNHKILIAEDEQANLRLVTTLFEKCHAQVITAGNGSKAFELVKTNPDISLVIMDINMPVMDGTTAMKLIKNRFPGLPVIALTAYALPRDKRQFKDSGFNDLVTKPIRNINLLNMVSKYLLTGKTTQD